VDKILGLFGVQLGSQYTRATVLARQSHVMSRHVMSCVSQTASSKTEPKLTQSRLRHAHLQHMYMALIMTVCWLEWQHFETQTHACTNVCVL